MRMQSRLLLSVSLLSLILIAQSAQAGTVRRCKFDGTVNPATFTYSITGGPASTTVVVDATIGNAGAIMLNPEPIPDITTDGSGNGSASFQVQCIDVTKGDWVFVTFDPTPAPGGQSCGVIVICKSAGAVPQYKNKVGNTTIVTK